MSLTFDDIKKARQRISPYVFPTPVVTSGILNRLFGHEFFFKAENLQRIGAFKARGAMNTLLWAKENNALTPIVAAVSSGNHAQAVAWAASQLNVKAKIFMPANVSKIKVQATKAYGAEVILAKDRQAADAGALAEQKVGSLFVPPYDHDQVICGQGTACLEAAEVIANLDAAVAPVGGGGLISGTLLAAKGMGVSHVFGAEPDIASDATQSYRTGKIHTLTTSPNTICDGVRTLGISERTFEYIKQLDDMIECTDHESIVTTQWLTHLLKLTVEPTAALSFVAAVKWARRQKSKKRILVILTGGNMDQASRTQVYAQDWLEKGLEQFAEEIS